MCVSKRPVWDGRPCCYVVALQGQMKINVLPLPIPAASTVLNVRLPLSRLFWFPPKVDVWCWQSSAKVYCMHACCVLQV
jgi:hypothetical protein